MGGHVRVGRRRPKWQFTFSFFWIGQSASLVGSALVQFALIWWLTIETASPSTLAVATAMGFVPTVVLGPFAGALVDRWPRKAVLIASDAFIALFTAGLGVLFWLGLARPAHVYVIMFARSVGEAFHLPAVLATTPLLVPERHLTRVAGMNRVLEGAVRLVAPPFGALLLSAFHVQGVLFVDIATAAAAIAMLLCVGIRDTRRKAVASNAAATVFADFREGVRYVGNAPGVRLMLITAAFWGLVVFAPWVAFPPILVTQHFGGGVTHLALMQSAFGASVIAGGAALMAWGGFKRRILTSVTGTVGLGTGMLVTGLAPAGMFWLAVLGWSLAGLAYPIHGGPIHATYQAIIPAPLQGRFFALNQSVVTAMAPISLAIAGPLAEVVGVRPFFVASAVVAYVIASVRRFSPLTWNIENGGGSVPQPEGA